MHAARNFPGYFEGPGFGDWWEVASRFLLKETGDTYLMVWKPRHTKPLFTGGIRLPTSRKDLPRFRKELPRFRKELPKPRKLLPKSRKELP